MVKGEPIFYSLHSPKIFQTQTRNAKLTLTNTFSKQTQLWVTPIQVVKGRINGKRDFSLQKQLVKTWYPYFSNTYHQLWKKINKYESNNFKWNIFKSTKKLDLTDSISVSNYKYTAKQNDSLHIISLHRQQFHVTQTEKVTTIQTIKQHFFSCNESYKMHYWMFLWQYPQIG